VFLIAILVGICIFFLIWIQVAKFRQCEKMMFETNEVGRILVLFVQDFKKMPLGLDELCEKGYLKKLSDNVFISGPKTKDRRVENLGSFEGVHIQFMNEIKIHFSMDKNQRTIIQVSPEYSEAMKWAKIYSDIILDLLRKPG
jgi:hypothetical protein